MGERESGEENESRGYRGWMGNGVKRMEVVVGERIERIGENKENGK